MIPSHLEKLIHEGKAIPKVANIGIGYVSSIQLPENSYGIIWSIIVYPFSDSGDVVNEVLTQDQILRQLWLRSKLGSDHFIIRPHYNKTDAQFSSFSPIILPCYLIHDGIIKVTFAPFQPISSWALVDISSLPDSSNEEPNHGGAGTVSILPSVKVLRAIDFDANDKYSPPTTTRDNAAIYQTRAPQITSSIPADQPDFSNVGNFGGYACPLLTINYCVLRGKPNLLSV